MRNVILLLIFVTAFSCKTSKIQTADNAVIIIQKTPCFGTCPEYEMMIFNDRTVFIDARQHLPIKGKFRSELSQAKYQELIEMFENSSFFDFEDRYTSNITDLPTTYLTYRNESQAKKIMDYHGAPQELKALENAVHDIIAALDWKEVKED